MGRFLAIIWVVAFSGTVASAQDGTTTPGARHEARTEDEADIAASERAAPEPSKEEDLPPQLRAPPMQGLQLPSAPEAEAEDDFGSDFEEEDFDESALDEGDDPDMAAEDAKLLSQAEPPAADPTLASWTNPRPVFSLNGFFRVRGDWNNNFSLGRVPLDRLFVDPFGRWIPINNGPTTGQPVLPAGGCSGPPSNAADPETQRCSTTSLFKYANMKLRLQPTLSLSDNIRVHMMIDAFDNLVLGSTPEVKSVNQLGQVTGRAPGVPVDSLTRTVAGPEAFRNTVRDALLVRRVWGEVTNSTIGQVRFGRMGHQFGLGMLWNAGINTNVLNTVLDQDFQSDVDRIQLIGKFKGVFFGVSWDFANKGYTADPVADIQAIPRDASTLDDTRQWSFLVARRLDPLTREKRLRRGKWVINGGGYFIYRTQFLSTSTAPLLTTPEVIEETAFVRRDAKVYIPDGWFQALWKDLRIELEVAGIFGQIQNITPGGFPPTAEGAAYKLRQWGFALETEYRTLGKKLGVFLKAGAASGDPDVVGLSQYENLAAQPVGQKTISTFSFHPNYEVDLIFFRQIMGAVAGAYYLAPAISYDIIRSDFGRLLSAKLDFIYSRAMYQQQSYSSEPNLGAEIDLSVYYRTENGPQFTDGFFVAGQFGILFPLNGLRYLEVDGVTEPGAGTASIRRAITMRLVMGIQF